MDWILINAEVIRFRKPNCTKELLVVGGEYQAKPHMCSRLRGCISNSYEDPKGAEVREAEVTC